MIDRKEELKQIDEFLKHGRIKIGPPAFVCPSVQAKDIERDLPFIHTEFYKKTWVKKSKR